MADDVAVDYSSPDGFSTVVTPAGTDDVYYPDFPTVDYPAPGNSLPTTVSGAFTDLLGKVTDFAGDYIVKKALNPQQQNAQQPANVNNKTSQPTSLGNFIPFRAGSTMTSNLVWVAGLAFFTLLIVALARR